MIAQNMKINKFKDTKKGIEKIEIEFNWAEICEISTSAYSSVSNEERAKRVGQFIKHMKKYCG